MLPKSSWPKHSSRLFWELNGRSVGKSEDYHKLRLFCHQHTRVTLGLPSPPLTAFSASSRSAEPSALPGTFGSDGGPGGTRHQATWKQRAGRAEGRGTAGLGDAARRGWGRGTAGLGDAARRGWGTRHGGAGGRTAAPLPAGRDGAQGQAGGPAERRAVAAARERRNHVRPSPPRSACAAAAPNPAGPGRAVPGRTSRPGPGRPRRGTHLRPLPWRQEGRERAGRSAGLALSAPRAPACDVSTPPDAQADAGRDRKNPARRTLRATHGTGGRGTALSPLQPIRRRPSGPAPQRPAPSPAPRRAALARERRVGARWVRSGQRAPPGLERRLPSALPAASSSAPGKPAARRSSPPRPLRALGEAPPRRCPPRRVRPGRGRRLRRERLRRPARGSLAARTPQLPGTEAETRRGGRRGGVRGPAELPPGSAPLPAPPGFVPPPRPSSPGRERRFGSRTRQKCLRVHSPDVWRQLPQLPSPIPIFCKNHLAVTQVPMEPIDLPAELWRLILSHLRLPELGRCSTVCRAWRQLVLSLDRTRWRQLCLGVLQHRPPSWPNRPAAEPPSWRDACKQHYLASKTWTRNMQDPESSTCLSLFRRRKGRRRLCVGMGGDFSSLRAALAAAGPYDRLVLLPGVHEEQSEVLLKMPVELVGQGGLGDVVLRARVDQHGPTARLCNLVLLPPHSSSLLYKTTSGYVQFDNCRFEGGQLQIHAPGTYQVKFCTFSRSSIHLHSVALCVLENCEFMGSENASVTVEGCPSSDCSWACKHLAMLAKSCAVSWREPSLARRDSWGESLLGLKRTCDVVRGEEQSSFLSVVGTPALLSSAQKDGEFGENLRAAEEEGYPALDSDSSDDDLLCNDEEDAQAAHRLPCRAHSLSHTLADITHRRLHSDRLHNFQRHLQLKSLQQELQQDKEAQSLANSLHGCVIRQCLFKDGKGGIFIYSQGQAKLEGSIFRDLTYAVRCIQNSKVIMLGNDIHHCKASGIFLRLSAGGLIADNSIHSNGEAGVDIRKGANPLVLCNKIHSGLRSGIVVVGNGKGIIRSNQIYGNKEAGIYILYNGNPAVSGNHIFQGLAAGIAVNKNGRGHITGNVICENQWGGVDIRHGGDPILRSNLISCGYSDGVVVGERGKGLIEGNAIYGNKGCGVWMMSSSLPHLINNQISHNSIYGVAVFCCKDDAGDYPPGQGGIESFQEDREGSGVENDPDSEEEHPAAQCPISVALVELNSISHNGAAGLHVKSSEALNIFANMIHANSDGGVSVLQSSQLTCIANNSISCNSRAGVLVEAECQVELRGNGVYENGSHGIVSKGEGIITENDIIDNHQCGLQLLQAAHMKVTKNRIQSFRDYGIALFDEAKGLVQENLIFQGRSKKSILRPISNAEDCVIQNNVLLSFKKRFDTECMLTSPSARPHIEGGALGSCTVAGGQRVSSVSTRVDEGCHKHGSVFCTVL